MEDKNIGGEALEQQARIKMLRECFDYDPTTGNLVWRERPRGHFASDDVCAGVNKRYAGKVAGCHTLSCKRGVKKSVCVTLGYKYLAVHRIVWELHNGPIPVNMVIDHIDRDPYNNRLENLRCVTTAENQYNRGASKTSRTGVKGVLFVRGRYHAKITVNYKNIHIGTFATLPEAEAAYNNAAATHHIIPASR